MNIDFDNHVALIAQIDEDGRPSIVGGGRYIVVEAGRAEIAFVVVDAYQGQGIGSALMLHLSHLARDAGLKGLIAEVLPENTAMLKVFSKFGFRPGPNESLGSSTWPSRLLELIASHPILFVPNESLIFPSFNF